MEQCSKSSKMLAIRPPKEGGTTALRSLTRGERAAAAYSLIAPAKLNDLNLEAWRHVS